MIEAPPSRPEERGRIVALDYGRRRIGLAVSDPTRTIATPHGVVRNDAPPGEVPEALLRELERLEPVLVLLGIPLQVDGSEGAMAREVRAFGRRLAGAAGVPVAERDESLTTEEARRALIEAGVPRGRRRRKGADDAMAAALLLREYLDAEAAR